MNKLRSRKRHFSVLVSRAFALALFLPLLACSNIFDGSDEAEQARGAFLLNLFTPSTCLINGVSFSTNPGDLLVCDGSTATGTGTLTALSDSSDDFSAQFAFQLQSGGSLTALAGTNTISFGNGHGVSVTSAAGTGVRPDNGVGGAIVSPGTEADTWCLEVHMEENPPHILAGTNGCPTGTANVSTVDFNSEDTPVGGATGKLGNKWGFILSNATLSSVTLNSSVKYTE